MSPDIEALLSDWSSACASADFNKVGPAGDRLATTLRTLAGENEKLKGTDRVPLTVQMARAQVDLYTDQVAENTRLRALLSRAGEVIKPFAEIGGPKAPYREDRTDKEYRSCFVNMEFQYLGGRLGGYQVKFDIFRAARTLSTDIAEEMKNG